jgi:hypothetical protein
MEAAGRYGFIGVEPGEQIDATQSESPKVCATCLMLR